MNGSVIAASRRYFRRSGFTLLEVLLVLGVMAVFASMTLPSVLRMFGQQKLTESAEKVRAAAASTRVRAIESGLVYQFCCESNGSRFVVVPFEPDHANSQVNGQTGAVSLSSRASGRLPKGIVFSSVIVRSSGSLATANSSHKIASTTFDGLPNASDLANVDWSIPILFNPEGSASADAEITVSDSKSQHIKLQVRAFTGAVSLERLVAEKR